MKLSIDLFHRVVVVVHERLADIVLDDVDVVTVRFVLDRWRGGRVELLDEDLDDLGEPVEVEYVERDTGDDAYELVDERDRVPVGRVHEGEEHYPIGYDGEYAKDGVDDDDQIAVDLKEQRVLAVEREQAPAYVQEDRGRLRRLPKERYEREHAGHLQTNKRKSTDQKSCFHLLHLTDFTYRASAEGHNGHNVVNDVEPLEFVASHQHRIHIYMYSTQNVSSTRSSTKREI